ncbi:MAG: sugar phosphate isomerase/epimerase family protein [Planctomycetota bacterium]
MMLGERTLDRRDFLGWSIGSVAAMASVSGCGGIGYGLGGSGRGKVPQQRFSISLAQWSLHRTLQSGKMSNLDFPRMTREVYGLDAVEYVNSFFKDKARDEKYLARLKQQCSDNGVKSLLIMCDGEGRLGDPGGKERAQAIQNHHRWIDAAKYLGCHSIRVNAASAGTYDEQMKLAADGLARLTDYGATQGLNVIVENHGGLSSNGAWLAGVMEIVNHPRCGTLPDFGNFNLGGGKTYDRYVGVEELMPFAKAVSAKSHDFDSDGNEKHTDYRKMMKIVIDANYHGYVGIEFEGGGSETAGILATKSLLEKVREELYVS